MTDDQTPNDNKQKRDPVPLWIMGVLVLTVLVIVWYGP